MKCPPMPLGINPDPTQLLAGLLLMAFSMVLLGVFIGLLLFGNKR